MLSGHGGEGQDPRQRVEIREQRLSHATPRPVPSSLQRVRARISTSRGARRRSAASLTGGASALAARARPAAAPTPRRSAAERLLPQTPRRRGSEEMHHSVSKEKCSFIGQVLCSLSDNSRCASKPYTLSTINIIFCTSHFCAGQNHSCNI